MSLKNLKNFTVKEETQISPEDKAFLEKHQSLYENALSFYESVYELYQKAISKSEFSDSTKYPLFQLNEVSEYICSQVNAIQLQFINQIYSFFQRKYRLNLDSHNWEWNEKFSDYYNLSDEDIREKLKKMNYMDIVADILSQTGGMSFWDLSKQQLKEKMKDACKSYLGQWQISLKGATLKYTGWTMRKTWNGNYSYDYDVPDFVKLLPEVLSEFLYQNPRINLPGCNFLRKYNIELTPEELKQGFDVSEFLHQVKKIKFYKNGRVDITFDSSERACFFAREWCGYMPAA